MRLIYFQSPRPNFGDDLNAVLWPALAPDLFDREHGAEGFLGIGTIVGMPTPDANFLHVFSSGVGYDPVERWRTPRELWCVRGPLSAKALGAPAETALTDGAILTGRLLDGEAEPERAGVAVVPHWESLLEPGWEEACAAAGFDLVSPMQDPLTVVRALRRARLVVTESLHGAILADALGVPWVAFGTSGNFSVFKWKDWTASVGTALCPVAVPPPSSGAWRRYGRIRFAAPGERPVLDEDAAWADYRARAGAGRRPGAGGGAVASLKRFAKGAADKAGVLDALFRLSPERTAEALTRAAEAEPCLSDPVRREALAAEMLERLEALRLRAAREPRARPPLAVGA